MKSKGFKIYELETYENRYLGTLKLSFTNENDNLQENYFTTLIGPNGTGKSYILRTLIDIFREIFNYKIEGKRSYHITGSFFIKYSFNENVYEIGNIVRGDKIKLLKSLTKDSTLTCKKNGEPVSELKDIQLPEKLLASSILLTDKFPVIATKQGFDIYNYLGVRRTPSVAGTRTLARITAQNLVEISEDKNFLENLEQILKYLNINGNIIIGYTPRYFKEIYNKDLTVDGLIAFFDDYAKKKRTTQLRGENHFRKIEKNKELLQEIVKYIHMMVYKIVPYSKDYPRSKKFELHILSVLDIKKEFEIIKQLGWLDLISFPYIQIINEETNTVYDFEDSSSGEYHIFTSLIGLLAKVKDNSVVLIDEPEISMHPNWQMQYFEILNKLFKKYTGCHFIIATHSHFLISDLKGENSKIIGLKRDKIIEVVDLPDELNAYGWPAEKVLLNVFGVATTRNFYIAEKLSQIFKVAASSKNPNLEEYKEEILKWHKQLKENDPLHYAIEKLIEKIGWLN